MREGRVEAADRDDQGPGQAEGESKDKIGEEGWTGQGGARLRREKPHMCSCLSVCKDSLPHSQVLPRDILNYPLNHGKAVKTSVWGESLNTSSLYCQQQTKGPARPNLEGKTRRRSGWGQEAPGVGNSCPCSKPHGGSSPHSCSGLNEAAGLKI